MTDKDKNADNTKGKSDADAAGNEGANAKVGAKTPTPSQGNKPRREPPPNAADSAPSSKRDGNEGDTEQNTSDQNLANAIAEADAIAAGKEPDATNTDEQNAQQQTAQAQQAAVTSQQQAPQPAAQQAAQQAAHSQAPLSRDEMLEQARQKQQRQNDLEAVGDDDNPAARLNAKIDHAMSMTSPNQGAGINSSDLPGDPDRLRQMIIDMHQASDRKDLELVTLRGMLQQSENATNAIQASHLALKQLSNNIQDGSWKPVVGTRAGDTFLFAAPLDGRSRATNQGLIGVFFAKADEGFNPIMTDQTPQLLDLKILTKTPDGKFYELS